MQLGDTQSALEFYQQGLEIDERLATADPNNAQMQRDLSISYYNLGVVQMQLGELQSALELHEQGLGIRERLAVADPTNALAQRDLSISYNQLGDVHLRLGNAQSALEFFQRNLEIASRLAAADPTNAETQRDLAVASYKLGAASQALLDYDNARAHFTTAIAILDEMIENGQNITQSQRNEPFVANTSAPPSMRSDPTCAHAPNWTHSSASRIDESLLSHRIHTSPARSCWTKFCIQPPGAFARY